MRSAKFKSLSYRVKYLNGKYDKSLFRQIKQLKDKTSELDFGCKFNSKGECNTSVPGWKTGKKKCCCRICADNIGYLSFIPSDYYLKYYAERFDEQDGFWREGKGCILDRNMRSNTCVLYTCMDIDRRELNLLDEKLYNLTYYLRQARRYNYEVCKEN